MATDSALWLPPGNDERITRDWAKYPALWRAMAQAWQEESRDDACWLTYSANYLLRTAGVRWALDPFSLLTRTGGGDQTDFVRDLESLQLIALTHAHSDHLDSTLLASIRCLPITWVIPEFMQGVVAHSFDLPAERVLSPEPGCPIHFGPLTLTPFEGLHFRGASGVPAMGYLAEFNEKRWLFPGDTRSYCPDRLPEFGGLDGVFAHLWLGKGRALDDDPPLLDEFCRFFTALRPKRLVVTHLQELGRGPEDFWDLKHFRRVQAKFASIAPAMGVSAALTGQRVEL